MADVPLLVVSDSTSSERRITPSWSISHLKAKLETITGVPPSSQRLSLNVRGQQPVPIEAADEDATTLNGFPLEPYADLIVTDTRPPAARLNLNDTTGVEKYVLPETEYEKKQDSVLAWKKTQKLGRFDPDAPGQAEARAAAHARDAADRGVEPGRRCRVGADDSRRGVVRYVGDVPEIPGAAGFWVGVHLDEPVGKNDGSIGGKRYWGEEGEAGGLKHGVFVRPERVEVGDFPLLNDLADDLDMEEI